MIKTFIIALVASLSISSAFATDLPSRKSTPIPPIYETYKDFYVGGNLGGNFGKPTAFSGGISAGWNVLPYLAIEATYDFASLRSTLNLPAHSEHTVAINAVPHVQINGTDFSVYGLGGVGYQWNTAGLVNRPVYDIGGGVKYNLTENLDIDARFRHFDSLNKKYGFSENRATIGIDYRF